VRKYIVRKGFDEKNIDPLNVPERSVFFQKTQQNSATITNKESDKNNQKVEANSSKLTKNQEIKSNDSCAIT